MKRLIFLPAMMLICAGSPYSVDNPAPNLRKLPIEKLVPYMREERDICDPGRDYEEMLPESKKKIDLACDNLEVAYKELDRRGYHFHYAEKDGDQNCWLGPKDKSCDDNNL